MNAALKSRLDSLRANYGSIKGAPFEYFFCPFLFRDENVTLCKGHVLNEALGVGKSIWTVQRKDVDGFFGSRFEADLTNLRYRGAFGTHDVLSNRNLRRVLRPRIFSGDREVEYFIPQGVMPNYFTTVHSTENSLPPMIGLKMSQRELEDALDADWHIKAELDLRVGSLVSLLKAAYLTQFALFGYRYVLSPAGHLIGHQMLGRLFQECETASIRDAQQYAKKELVSCINMVRPLLDTELNLRGTILDRQILVAWSASGFPWATIIIVPAGDTLHGVMLPVGDHVEGIVTWNNFMNNENESIAIKLGRFDPAVEGGLWQLSKQSWRIQWPKGGSFADAAPRP